MYKRKKSYKIAYSAIICAIYVVLSVAVLPMSSGAIQVRISEGLTLLSLVFPEAILGVSLGCAITNFICALPLLDIVFGSLVTCLAGIGTYCAGVGIKNKTAKFFIGGAFPILFNAFFLPLIWLFMSKSEYVYMLQVLFIFLGESISVYGFGYLVMKAVEIFFNKT